VKRIEIIISERWLQDINDILRDANVSGMSYHRIEGRSRAKVTEFIPKFKIEVVVRDDQVQELVKTILDQAGGDLSTGGKVFVLDVPMAVDLATKNMGENAL
jgi:nitrogen regulatory protein P-II 1